MAKNIEKANGQYVALAHHENENPLF